MRRVLTGSLGLMLGCVGSTQEAAEPVPQVVVATAEPSAERREPVEEPEPAQEAQAEDAADEQAGILGLLKPCGDSADGCVDGPGTIGHGSGTGQGFGGGRGRLGGSQVSPDELSTKGKLDKAIIRRIVRARLSQMRFCYEKELANDPKLEGKITLSFAIDTEGNVANVQSDSSLGNQAVESCVTGVFQRMVFPKPEGGIVTVRYPIVFSAQGD
jgi:TonB family protein